MGDTSKGAAEFEALSYPVEITEDDNGYFVRIPDLPGCESSGATLAEAMYAIDEAKAAWIATALELGKTVPVPRGDDDYSGKFVVRVGPSVHRDLVRLAQLEGMSLNTFVATTLARETGRYPAQAAKGASGVTYTSEHTHEITCDTRPDNGWRVYTNAS
ncbi:MAG: toxin-antitoxin system HicB family antitoxin [Coriobacteriia bacterium]